MLKSNQPLLKPLPAPSAAEETDGAGVKSFICYFAYIDRSNHDAPHVGELRHRYAERGATDCHLHGTRCDATEKTRTPTSATSRIPRAFNATCRIWQPASNAGRCI